MSKNYEQLKIVGFNNNEYWFYDCWGLTECRKEVGDYMKYKVGVKGILIVKDEVGNHACIKSVLWDDMEGYVDLLQSENTLPENQLYIVTYFKYADGGLEQLVDYGITKQQIIDNVNNQKYIEGADYFTIDQLTQLENMVA